MNYDRIIVDGHSLLYRVPACTALQRAGRTAQARLSLLRRLERVAGRLAARWTIVFDGRQEGGPGDEPVPSGMTVLYSPGHLTADSVIERLVAERPPAERVLVVTSDRPERDTVEAAGAHSMGCTDFLELCERTAATAPADAPRRRLRPTLGDLLDLEGPK